MFQFSFIGCTDFEENASLSYLNQQENPLTNKDYELINALSESYDLSLKQAFSRQKEFNSLGEYGFYAHNNFEENFNKSLKLKKTRNQNYSIKTSEIHLIERQLEAWAIDVGIEIDMINENEIDSSRVINLIDSSLVKFQQKIVQSTMKQEDKRVALILLSSYSNFTKSTAINLFQLKNSLLTGTIQSKCNFWKRAKWIIKCTALSVYAGATCIAAAKDLDWTKGSKCVISGIAAIDCWSEGCK